MVSNDVQQGGGGGAVEDNNFMTTQYDVGVGGVKNIPRSKVIRWHSVFVEHGMRDNSPFKFPFVVVTEAYRRQFVEAKYCSVLDGETGNTRAAIVEVVGHAGDVSDIVGVLPRVFGEVNHELFQVREVKELAVMFLR